MMSANRPPENFEELRGDNVIVGFVDGKAIIEAEGKELHYIEGIGPEHGEIGEAVPDGMFKSIRLLPAQEQDAILESIQEQKRHMKRLSAADVISQCHNEERSLLFGQFLDDFYHAKDKSSLIAEEPPTDDTVEPWYLCFLAGSVHKLANDYHLSVPEWVFDKKYTYDGIYYAYETKNQDYQRHLEKTTPEEYTKRNIFIGDNALERC